MNNPITDDRWQARLLAEQKAVRDFSSIKEKYVIDGNVDYPEPEYLIRIGDVPTLPKGNLVAVSAKWKNGKTFFCDILSAIFLGSDVFPNCENLIKQGKVRFIDTEQARNDTARILKTIQAIIPEERHGDIEVSCLRDADIDSYDTGNDDVSRYEFVRKSIEIERPDLVIVDGIADLIYNYNDAYGQGVERRTYYPVDQKKKYTFSFLADKIPNVRSLFHIDGKQYLCERLTAMFTEDGMSHLIKGNFFKVI